MKRQIGDGRAYVQDSAAIEAKADEIMGLLEAIAAGTRPVPFQIHNATSILLGDTDRVIAALSAQKPGELVKQWAGASGKGLDAVTANIEKSKYAKTYPGHDVTVEQAGWKLPNDEPAFKVVVRTKQPVAPADTAQAATESVAMKSSEVSADAANSHEFRLEAEKIARERYANKDPIPVDVSSTGDRIYVSWASAKHILRDGLPDWKTSLAVLHMEELARTATEKSDFQPDYKGRKDPSGVFIYTTSAKFDGVDHKVEITVRQHTDGKRYYDHLVVESKTPAGLPESSTSNTAAGASPTPPYAGVDASVAKSASESNAPAAPEVKADDVEPKIMQHRPSDWPYANYGWVMVGGGRNVPGASSENGAKIELSKNPEWKERGAVILPFRWNDGGLRGASPYADTTTRYAILVRQKESPRIEAPSETPAAPEVKKQQFTPADVAAAEKQAIGMIQAAIDKMKADAAQRFAVRLLPTMGVKVPVGKARINAAMNDPKINLLGAADALGVEFAKSITDALVAKMEGRVSDVVEAKRNIWIPNMTVGKLEALLAKSAKTPEDIEKLKDFRYFLLHDEQSAIEKGFKVPYQADGGAIYVLKNKFWLTNIDAAITQKPAAAIAKEGNSTPAPAISASSASSASSAEPSNTENAGEELKANRRGKRTTGLQWAEIEGKDAALRVAETVKAKVYPKPDYQAIADAATHPLVAYIVKLAYDAIAPKPNTATAPTDAQLKGYIEGVNAYMAGVLAWASDAAKTKQWLVRQGTRAGVYLGAASGTTTALSGLNAVTEKTLLETVYPDGWRNHEAQVRLIGANKALGALQPGLDDASKGMKELDKGWPSKQEAWQKQGYRIIKGDDLKPDYFENDTKGNERVSAYVQMRLGGRNVYVAQKSFNGITSRADPQVQAWVTEQMAKYQGQFLVMDKRNNVVDFAATEDAAKDKARERTKRESGPDRIDEKGISVEAAKRTGVDRRMPGEDISADRLMQTYGFKGVNFGNWMLGDSNAKERQLHLNHAFDAFADLAEVLEIPPKAISMNGMLGFAIGAQGKGGRAAAHFVPGVNEINLTREAGAGALAHEWGHALDHSFAKLAGLDRETEAFLTEHSHFGAKIQRFEKNADGKHVNTTRDRFGPELRPEILERFKAIVQAMEKRAMTPEEVAAQKASYLSMSKSRLESWVKSVRKDFASASKDNAETLAAFDKLAEKITALDVGDGKIAASKSTYISPVVDELRSLYKKAAGRQYSIDQIKGLQSAIESVKYASKTKDDVHVPQTTSTKYASEAGKLDRDEDRKPPYWRTKLEMFARAFDAYVSDKLAAKAANNTYLHGLNKDERTVPVGDERTVINAQFDALVQTIETKETDGGNVAMFSQNLVAPKSSGPKPTLEQIQGFVEKILQVAKNVIPVSVIASPHEIAGVKVPVGTKPTGAVIDGRIYLFADNIGSVGSAYVTLFHEVFHLGLQKVIPAEDYAAMLKQFANSPLVAKYIRLWKDSAEGVQKAKTMPSQNYEALANEEALAMVSETLAANDGMGTKNLPGLAKVMLNWLAKVADRIGMPVDFSNWVRDLTRTEAERFVNDMVRAVLGGQKNLTKTQAKYGTVVENLGGVGVRMSDKGAPLLAPNGKPSKLTPGQHAQVRTAEFKAWFGDWENDPDNASKVVDENGEPLRLFHGTAISSITVFKGSRGSAGHFAFDPKTASGFAKAAHENEQEILASGAPDMGDGGQVYPVYIKAENIFDARNQEHLDAIGVKRDAARRDYEWLETQIDAIKAAGFDSYYDFESDLEVPSAIAAFDPTQVKSAIGNNGQFDPKNPDIRFSTLGGAVQATQDALKNATVTDLIKQFGNRLSDFRGMGLQTLGRRQLVDIYSKDLPALVPYSDMVAQMALHPSS